MQFVVECTDNLNVFINAYEVDVICGPIVNQTIDFAQQHYPHLQNLPLADSASGDGRLEVDFMIGADYYWSFVQNHVVRGESSYKPRSYPYTTGLCPEWASQRTDLGLKSRHA